MNSSLIKTVAEHTAKGLILGFGGYVFGYGAVVLLHGLGQWALNVCYSFPSF